MNIDISNAHCGPRIQFPDHAWLRVVLRQITLLAPAAVAAAAALYARGWRDVYGVRAIVERSPGLGRDTAETETRSLVSPVSPPGRRSK